MKIPFEILDDDLGLRIILFLKTKHELYKNTYEVLLKALVSFSKPAGAGGQKMPFFLFSGTRWGNAKKLKVTFKCSNFDSGNQILFWGGENASYQEMRCR